jgi:hypothetical protein
MLVRAAEEAELKETMSAVKPVVVAGALISGLAIGVGAVGAAVFLQHKELAHEKLKNRILEERGDALEARLTEGQRKALYNIFDTQILNIVATFLDTDTRSKETSGIRPLISTCLPWILSTMRSHVCMKQLLFQKSLRVTDR